MNDHQLCCICGNPEVNVPCHGLAAKSVCAECRNIILSAKKEIPRYLKGGKHGQPRHTVRLKKDAHLLLPDTAIHPKGRDFTTAYVEFQFDRGGNWMCTNIKDGKGRSLNYQVQQATAKSQANTLSLH